MARLKKIPYWIIQLKLNNKNPNDAFSIDLLERV